jgi:hypothetical protein
VLHDPHLIFLDFIIRTILDEENISLNSSLCTWEIQMKILKVQ